MQDKILRVILIYEDRIEEYGFPTEDKEASTPPVSEWKKFFLFIKAIYSMKSNSR